MNAIRSVYININMYTHISSMYSVAEFKYYCVNTNFQFDSLCLEILMKTDILLLADVFENYRNDTHEMYELDPAHYFTLPGLSFDAMLKHTKAHIELLTDIDMLHFVERGIRGGISQCSKRYAKANNKHMKEHYNPNEKSFIQWIWMVSIGHSTLYIYLF